MHYPKTYPGFTRAIFTSLILAVLSCSVAHASSLSVTLPGLFTENDLLTSCLKQPGPQDVSLKASADALADNNVGSIWEMADDQLEGREFSGSSAYAVLATNSAFQAFRDKWLIGYGRGKRDAYIGNNDAAQLWIDLNTENRMLGTYSPELKNTRISYSWLGVGREFPFKFSKARGKGRVILRRIESDDYRGGSVVGQVIGENYSGTGADSYTGMMRIMSSRAPEGVVVGRGWTVDAQADFSAGERIKGMVTCEGLAGYVSWHGLNVQDTFITSMGVFEDPEGYLHDFGGISGAEWREDVKLDLAARYRLDMLYMHEPSLMLGIAYREGDGASVSTGAAWTHSKSLIPYFRWHISDQALELGAVGRKLQLRILSDDWLFTSPEHMEVNLTATALTF